MPLLEAMRYSDCSTTSIIIIINYIIEVSIRRYIRTRSVVYSIIIRVYKYRKVLVHYESKSIDK